MLRGSLEEALLVACGQQDDPRHTAGALQVSPHLGPGAHLPHGQPALLQAPDRLLVQDSRLQQLAGTHCPAQRVEGDLQGQQRQPRARGLHAPAQQRAVRQPLQGVGVQEAWGAGARLRLQLRLHQAPPCLLVQEALLAG